MYFYEFTTSPHKKKSYSVSLTLPTIFFKKEQKMSGWRLAHCKTYSDMLEVTYKFFPYSKPHVSLSTLESIGIPLKTLLKMSEPDRIKLLKITFGYTSTCMFIMRMFLEPSKTDLN